MKKPQKNRLQKTINTFFGVAILLSVLSVTAFPALGEEDETNFIALDHGNYISWHWSCYPSKK